MEISITQNFFELNTLVFQNGKILKITQFIENGAHSFWAGKTVSHEKLLPIEEGAVKVISMNEFEELFSNCPWMEIIDGRIQLNDSCPEAKYANSLSWVGVKVFSDKEFNGLLRLFEI